MPFTIKKGSRAERTNALVLGAGIQLTQTADGLPEASANGPGEVVVEPSGSDDTQALKDAMWKGTRVRLAPGTFKVTGIIDVPEGVTVSGAGSGSGAQSGTRMTLIDKTDYNGPVFRLGDQTQFAGVESLRIRGPGKSIAAGNQAITAARSSAGLAIARRFRFRDLHIEKIGEFGIYLSRCANVEIENVSMSEIGYHGIYLSGGGMARISSVRVEGSGKSIMVRNASGVVVHACEVEGGYGSFHVDGSSDVVLDGCVSRGCGDIALRVTGGANVAVSGFLSDNTGASTDKPHLIVDGAAVGVVIGGFRRVNPSAITTEADVGAAGDPVLFATHNFDRAKVISATSSTAPKRFAEVSYTTP